jgi:hypothetical protein
MQRLDALSSGRVVRDCCSKGTIQQGVYTSANELEGVEVNILIRVGLSTGFCHVRRATDTIAHRISPNTCTVVDTRSKTCPRLRKQVTLSCIWITAGRYR